MNETTYPVHYYIGDLCYVMHDVWSEVCDLMFSGDSDEAANGELELADGRKIVIFSTAYGDGEYFDEGGMSYSVDSGTIGAIKFNDIRDPFPYLGGGNVHEFAAEIDGHDCWSENGELGFYKVVINTGDSDEDDHFEDEEEPEDEDA
jgi:hypothetical protein